MTIRSPRNTSRFMRTALLGGALLCALALAAVGTNGPGSAPHAFGPVAQASAATAPAAVRLAASKKILGPTKGLYTGIFEPPAPFTMGVLDTYKTRYRKRPAIVTWYQQWGDATGAEFQTSYVKGVQRRGAIPLITWEPWALPAAGSNPADMPRYSLDRILAGDFDDYIRRWARAAKACGGPIMLRPMHEMNGTWYPWGGTVNGNTPAKYRETWRYLHGIFAQEGATNVTWVWTPNHVSVPNTSANGYDAFYPGDAYVDWTGVSAFNWRNSIYPRGRTFDQLFTKPLAYFSTKHKPVVIPEIGCTTGTGINKPKWIYDSFMHAASRHHQVKAIVYYDKREPTVSFGTQNWQLLTSKASADAYRRAIGTSWFVGGSLRSLESTVPAL
ncbi:MAG: hypothetical protein HGB10_06565 [Coriobacteriia bacterium]|nr:hypothetical protein [Coriobacteriia bacterium]